MVLCDELWIITFKQIIVVPFLSMRLDVHCIDSVGQVTVTISDATKSRAPKSGTKKGRCALWLSYLEKPYTISPVCFDSLQQACGTVPKEVFLFKTSSIMASN